jgi:hypothetical protein
MSTQTTGANSAPVRPGLSLADLVHEAETNPPKPILEGLIHENEIVGLHGTQEVFKTLFCLLLAEALATGRHFLGAWKVSRPHAVFFLETEMSVSALGKRAQNIFGQTPAIPTRADPNGKTRLAAKLVIATQGSRH